MDFKGCDLYFYYKNKSSSFYMKCFKIARVLGMFYIIHVIHFTIYSFYNQKKMEIIKVKVIHVYLFENTCSNTSRQFEIRMK